MNTLETIQARRSIKHYDPEHEMSEEEVRQLLGLAMLSPTAFNIQNWRFVTVRDMELRKQIREAAWDQAQVTDCSLLVVLCGDLKSWEREPRRYWRDAPEEVADLLVPAIDGYYRDKPQVMQDEAMRSCGMAAQTIMLAAKAMGLESCPMDGFDFGKVGELINLPDDHSIAMFVAVGKGTKEPWARPGQLDYDEVVIRDRF